MNKFNLTFLSGVLACAIVVGCGNESLSSDAENGTGKTSVFITDAITDDFKKIWVFVETIALVNSAGEEFVIQSVEDGEIYNLAKYNNIGKLVGTFDAPSGDYAFVRVVLENSVSLMDEEVNVIDARFSTEGESFTIDVPATLTVRKNGREALAVDFDLEQFLYDSETGLVTPVLVYKDKSGVQSIGEVTAEVSGWVTNIIDETSFEFQTKHKYGGLELLVTVQEATAVVDKENDQTTSDTSLLMVGDKVEIAGNYDPDLLLIEAIEVVFKRDDDDNDDEQDGEQDDDELAEVEGVVNSYDGMTLVIDVIEAENFVPQTATLDITDVSNAKFIRGSLEMLAAGQEIEVKGDWVDGLFMAKLIKIEGAPRPGKPYAKLEGEVTAINGDLIDIQVEELEYGNEEIEDVLLTIDVSEAFYQADSVDCLEVGAELEAKGSYDGVTFDPIKVKVESDTCDHDFGDDDSDHDEENENENEDEDEDEDDDEDDDEDEDDD